MREKPLQWMLRAVWNAECGLGKQGLKTRAWNHGGACAGEVEHGVGALGFGSKDAAQLGSVKNFRIWNGGACAHAGAGAGKHGIDVLGFTRGLGFGLEDGAHGALQRLWDFTTTRAYAAAPAASSSKAGSGDGKEREKADRKINRAIVARMIRLVGDEGHEVLSRYEALNRAQQAGLDLVEVDGRADPPVCKLMDFSKERFKVKKQEKDLRKKQLERRRLDDLKEVRFSSRTEQKDLEMKAETVTRLLVRGHRVKLAVQFHGNDKGDEVGVELLERAMRLLQADVKVENGPRVEKMRAWVMIRPILEQKTLKKKEDSKIMQKTEDEDSNLTAVEVLITLPGENGCTTIIQPWYVDV